MRGDTKRPLPPPPPTPTPAPLLSPPTKLLKAASAKLLFFPPETGRHCSELAAANPPVRVEVGRGGWEGLVVGPGGGGGVNTLESTKKKGI